MYIIVNLSNGSVFWSDNSISVQDYLYQPEKFTVIHPATRTVVNHVSHLPIPHLSMINPVKGDLLITVVDGLVESTYCIPQSFLENAKQNKIQCIKELREATGADLRKAKFLVEVLNKHEYIGLIMMNGQIDNRDSSDNIPYTIHVVE